MAEMENGWREYQKLVLNELERHNDLIEGLRGDISSLRGDMVAVKVKIAMWSLATGTAGGGLVAYALKAAGGSS